MDKNSKISKSMEGNKNAEKWTLKEATSLKNDIIQKIIDREIQYLSDIDIVLGFSKTGVSYVLKKYNLYNEIRLEISKHKATRDCLFKRNDAQRKRDRINNKKRYKESLDKSDFRLRMSISSLIGYHLKNSGAKKTSNSKLDMLDFSIEELKNHLSNMFENGMTFDNYGEWHIDHIIPCSWFDLSDEYQFKQCWRLENLKPMWASQNCSKMNRYSENPQLKMLL
jgi:hypothetical protein